MGSREPAEDAPSPETLYSVGTVARMCRKVARAHTEGRKAHVDITLQNLADLLGPQVFCAEVAERTSVLGDVTGLAWTPTGGDILFVEATRMRGKGGLTLTGHLGEVMKESAQAALSYIRSNAAMLGIAEDLFERVDLHIHVPAGAIAKDGPSAGVAMVVALTSLLLQTPVKQATSMTGEITLRGKVLPVGGIKEKLLAAQREGPRGGAALDAGQTTHRVCRRDSRRHYGGVGEIAERRKFSTTGCRPIPAAVD